MEAGVEPGTSGEQAVRQPRQIQMVSYFGWMNRNPGGRRHGGCAWPDGVCASADAGHLYAGPE